MPSNTKLTKDQKRFVAQWKANNPRAKFFSNPYTMVTLLIVPEGTNLVKVYSAVCSKDEKKFRFKVGEYHAINRCIDKVGMVLPLSHEIKDYTGFSRLADSILKSLPGYSSYLTYYASMK